MKTDSLFYRLFQTLPQLLFDLIAQPTRLPAPRYHFASVELKQTAFPARWRVLLPPDEQPDWPVFFVEVQFQPDPELYSRLFAEVFLYLRQQRPVASLAGRGDLSDAGRSDPGDASPLSTCYCTAAR